MLPYAELLEPIRKHYPKRSNGLHLIWPEVMLRIHFMQLWYSLSDPAMEELTLF